MKYDPITVQIIVYDYNIIDTVYGQVTLNRTPFSGKLASIQVRDEVGNTTNFYKFPENIFVVVNELSLSDYETLLLKYPN
jgi:hypothetical protein